MRAALLLLLIASTPAHAEGWLGAQMGAGIEASRLGDAPNGLGSWAVAFEWIPAGRSWGLGLTSALLGRLSALYESHAAVHTDLMLRYATGDRAYRAGLGIGHRMIPIQPPDTADGIYLHGIDLVHVELVKRLGRWDDEREDIALALDGYVTWTLGCYHGRFTEGDLRDAPAMTVGCADTLASTIVVGLQLAMEWHRR